MAEEVRAEFKRIAVQGRDEEVKSVIDSITPQWVLSTACKTGQGLNAVISGSQWQRLARGGAKRPFTGPLVLSSKRRRV